ncbi:MAG: hypothetical protein D3906_00265 [Candidatus Electrothrix sp. AUS1_2]|nr:hypothetical protein [Candidatus Electrothrix sp. AUS1_2]
MSVSNDLDEKNDKNIGVYGNYAHIEGGITFNQGVIDPFVKENLDDVRSDEFIAPAHSQDIVQRVLSRRFLLLWGKDRMGKSALSRHIADMLLQENLDELPVKKIRQSFDLNDVLENVISEKKQNYIILGYDINIDEIQKNIDLLRRIARQESKYIIFTSEPPNSIPSDLQEFSVEVQINYPYTPQNIEKLLEQYFQAENIELKVELKGNIHSISKRLVSPSVAVRLAESLSKESTLPAYNEWVDRLNDLNDFHKEVNNWLGNLGKDECILFLTLALFHDLPDHNFWMIYEDVIDELKKRDPTLIKLDYYALEENREFIASGRRIAFKHTTDRDSILSRLLKLHRRSLLAILPFLGEQKQIDKFLYKKDMRLATAEAVGYIGTVEEKAAHDILYSWAKHKSALIRAAVGHAHRQMMKKNRDALGSILSEMSRYLRENNVGRKDDTIETIGPRWTVAASLGRINNYVSDDRFEQDILPIFEKVCKDEYVEVRKAAVYSMRTMGQSRFKQIRPFLSEQAKNFNVLVRLEVAATLAKLSMTNQSDIHQLLHEWLIGQDEARIWTAFYTLCLLDYQKEDQLILLQKQIYEDTDLQIKITNTLNNILINEKLENDTIINVFELVALHNDMEMNKILIVETLVANAYKYQGIAADIIQKWRDSSDKLKELALLIDEYNLEGQNVVTDQLNDNELNKILIGVGIVGFIIIVIWLLT